MSGEMVESQSSYAASVVLHALLVLFAAVGLPHLLPKKADPQPLVMTVEVLPITGVTNIKPSDQPIQEEKKTKAADTKKPVTEAPKEAPKPAQKAPAPPAPPQPVQQPKDAEPLPNSKPTDQKKEKPKEDKKPKPDDFSALLNKLQQEAKTDSKASAKDTTNAAENKTKSDAPYDPSLPMSLSEKDAIRGQFEKCWDKGFMAGAKDPHTLAARIHITVQPDGGVMTVELAPDQLGRYNSEPFFRAAADSAMRAVHVCSPLKNLPADKYNTWKDMELNFDPADLM